MEYLIALGILGLGYTLQNNRPKNINKKYIAKIKNSQIPSPDNVYTSRKSYNIFQEEQKKANVLLEKSKYPQDTNVITPGPSFPIIYNKVDYTDKNLPIEYNSYQKYDDITIDPNGTKPIPADEIKNNKRIPDTGGWLGISLTGDQINPNTFTHNNMTPFFGGGVKQNLDEFSTRGIFETFTGTQDNYQKKQEQGLLFEPQKNMSNVYGTGSLDGFMLDRYAVSNIRSNETPIERIYVGPGLNQGFTNEPSGGFQQPDAQDYAMPKTTDEIRVKTNPKISYYGRVVSGAKIAKPAKIGTVYKNRPDTFYVQDADRYLTTTGQIIAPEQRPCIVTKYTNRKTTELKTRTGSAAPTNGTVAQVRSKYKISHKVTYGNNGPRNADGTGTWSIMNLLGFGAKNGSDDSKNIPNDYGKNSIRIRNNKRVLNKDSDTVINFKSSVEKAVARNNQKLKHSKKNELIHNNRENGNYQGPKKSIVYDPENLPRTTIKESNIHNNHSGIVNAQMPNKGIAYDPNDIARVTIKETNIDNNHSGIINAQMPNKGIAYDPNDIARITIKETNIDNNHSGIINAQMPNKGIAYDPESIARTTIKETNIDNNYNSNIQNPNRGNVVYNPEAIARTTIKETNIHNNHKGILSKNAPSRGVVYDPLDTPRVTTKQTTLKNKRKGNMNNSSNGTYVKNMDNAKVTTKQTTSAHNILGIATQKRNDGYIFKEVQVPDTIREETSVQYIGDANGPELGAYEVTDVNAPNTLRQFTSDMEYFGGAGNDGVNSKPPSYEDIYNAEIKAIRGTIDGGYTPGAMGPNQGASTENMNVTTTRIGDIQNKYINERGVQANKVYNSIPQMTHVNMTQEKEIVPNEPLANRINPEIVSAFRDNPYTQSLTSWA
jgi:hypothetical protein